MCTYVCMYKLDDCVVLLLMQAFEGMLGMKAKSEAIEQANTRLREAICLPSLLYRYNSICVCVHKCMCMFVRIS